MSIVDDLNGALERSYAVERGLRTEKAALQARVAELEAANKSLGEMTLSTLARMAELEAENKQLRDRDIEANAALVSYETRMAQARAELEAGKWLTGGAVERALELLKGKQ